MAGHPSSDTVVPVERGPEQRPSTLADRALVAVAVLAGVALRAYAVTGTRGRTDSDEVLAGLMAGRLLEDGWPAFLWGQPYGGTLELAPLSLSVRVFGWNAVGLRLPVLVLAAGTSLVVWRVALRLLPPRAARVAGLLSWLGPPTAVWYSTREMLFYQPTVLLGMVVVLFGLRLLDERRSPVAHRWDAAGAGLAAGLGWWTSPNVAYLVVPAVVVLLVHRRRWWPAGGPTLVGIAAGSAVVGAVPWLAHNLAHGAASLRGTSAFPVVGSYASRLGWFLTDALPGALGGRETFTYAWTYGAVGAVIAVVALGALAAGWCRGARDLQWDTFALVLYPLLFALVPFGPDQPNMKYQFFLTPVLAVTLARLVGSRRSAAVLVAAVVAVSALGLARIGALGDERATPLLLPDLDRAVAVLDEQGITEVWGDYWTAYRLVWLSGERIVATNAKGSDRSVAYREQVEASPRPAWVVEAGEYDERLRADLCRLGVGYDVFPAEAYVVVVPERPVGPHEVDADLLGR